MYNAWLKVVKATSTSTSTSTPALRDVEVVRDYDSSIFAALGKAEGKGKKGKGGKGEEEEVEGELGNCAACGHGGGIMSVCKNDECGVSTHITCLSQHALRDEQHSRGAGGQVQILPTTSRCPRCKTEMAWTDVARGVTGRIRGKGGSGAVGAGAGASAVLGDESASGSGVESGSDGSETDSWAGVVEL